MLTPSAQHTGSWTAANNAVRLLGKPGAALFRATPELVMVLIGVILFQPSCGG